MRLRYVLAFLLLTVPFPFATAIAGDSYKLFPLPNNKGLMVNVTVDELNDDVKCVWQVFLDDSPVEVQQPVSSQRYQLDLSGLKKSGQYQVICIVTPQRKEPTAAVAKFQVGTAPPNGPQAALNGEAPPADADAPAAPAEGEQVDGAKFVADVIDQKLRLNLLDSKFHEHVVALAKVLRGVDDATKPETIRNAWSVATEADEYEKIMALVPADYLGRKAIPAGFNVGAKWMAAFDAFQQQSEAQAGGQKAFAGSVADALEQKDQDNEDFLDQLAAHMVRTGMVFQSAATSSSSGGEPTRSSSGSCRRQWRLRHCR